MRAAIVIPARYASERFPGKPLAAIGGVPMIVRVWQNMTKSQRAARVIVATDDERIAAAVRAAGGDVAMTDPSLPSGSDRVWAACADLAADVIVNVQGDEPLLPAAAVDQLIARLEADDAADIATGAALVPRAAASSADEVTVVTDDRDHAFYFSRTTIPHGAPTVLRHLGVYAYRRAALARFVEAPPAALERTERLEQLRALSLGLRIAVVTIDVPLQAVDRPHDVAKVERILAGRPPAPLVRAVALDVDGVLTNGDIAYPGAGDQLLTFNVKDGQGIKSLLEAGIKVGIISSRDSVALRRRCTELGIADVAAGVHDKAAALRAFSDAWEVPLEECCFVGDDLPDLAAFAVAGLSVAPADAVALVRERAQVVLTQPGGRGAVRELAERLLAERLLDERALAGGR